MKSPLLENLCVALLTGTLAVSCNFGKPPVRLYSPARLSDTQLQSITECLRDKGAVVYSAEWCYPCYLQKAYFGEFFSLLTEVDCTREDGISKFCKEKGVESVPLWEFSGKRILGLQNPKKLAKLAGCKY